MIKSLTTKILDQGKINWIVPQNIYLTDDTIIRNIALGIDNIEIDLSAIEKAAKIANLHEFVVMNYQINIIQL